MHNLKYCEKITFILNFTHLSILASNSLQNPNIASIITTLTQEITWKPATANSN